MNRPAIIHSSENRFTLGFSVDDEDGTVTLAGAFTKGQDVFKKRVGVAIVEGRLRKNRDVVTLGNRYFGNKPFQDLLVPLEKAIRQLNLRSDNRSADSIMRRAAQALNDAIVNTSSYANRVTVEARALDMIRMSDNSEWESGI